MKKVDTMTTEVRQDAMDQIPPDKRNKPEVGWESMARDAPNGERCWNCQNFNGDGNSCDAIFGYTTGEAWCTIYLQLRKAK